MKLFNENSITSDDILGKDVIDAHGDILGVTTTVHIDKVTNVIFGVTVDRGFMKPDLFVGVNNIVNYGVDTIFLRIIPNQKVKGMLVFDYQGRRVGKILSCKMDETGNNLTEIVVQLSSFKKTYIDAFFIDRIGYNVILKKEWMK